MPGYYLVIVPHLYGLCFAILFLFPLRTYIFSCGSKVLWTVHSSPNNYVFTVAGPYEWAPVL